MTDPTLAEDDDPAAAALHFRERHPWWAYGLLAFLVAALAFGAWGAWTVATDRDTGTGGAPSAELDKLAQQVATLSRSDQISRDANRDLQATLAERDEEIAGLRADVAFYERFVGSTAQRRGLTVHALDLRPQADGQVWHFTATLTQTLNRDAASNGRLTVSVEGTRDGKLERLSWSALRQQAEAPGREYSFKYFQRVEGDIVLPAGFVPLRANVRLVPQGGSALEQTFPWAEAVQADAGG